jgi:hypothetical protein
MLPAHQDKFPSEILKKFNKMDCNSAITLSYTSFSGEERFRMRRKLIQHSSDN